MIHMSVCLSVCLSLSVLLYSKRVETTTLLFTHGGVDTKKIYIFCLKCNFTSAVLKIHQSDVCIHLNLNLLSAMIPRGIYGHYLLVTNYVGVPGW